MHIEPGVVDGAKIVLSYGTAAGAAGLAGKMLLESLRKNGGIPALAIRSVIATVCVFGFFEVLPHYPVGVSEVHLILGSTLFLLFGAGAAAIGLALGLLAQGLLFAPFDLPQYAMNMTTLLVPLWGISQVAKRIIAPDTAYVDLRYSQALALSTVYQGGIVAWVAFWAFYGQGLGAENIVSVLSFGSAYMLVLLLEPITDLALLAGAKALKPLTSTALFNSRLHRTA